MITVTWFDASEFAHHYVLNDRVHPPKRVNIGFWRATDTEYSGGRCPDLALDWEPSTDRISGLHPEEYTDYGFYGECAEKLSAILLALLKKRAEVRAHV